MTGVQTCALPIYKMMSSSIIGLQGNRMTVEVDTKNPKIDEDIILYYDTLQKDGELIGERFRILKRLLDELGY